MRLNFKEVLLVVLVVCTVSSVCTALTTKYFCYKETPTSVNNYAFKSTEDLYKTVGHLKVDNPDMKLVYLDEDNDIAYYMYIGKDKLLKPEDKVYTQDNNEVTVTGCDVYGFYVDKPELFTTGMSGTSISNLDGETVGYVSKIIASKRVYCIWK